MIDAVTHKAATLLKNSPEANFSAGKNTGKAQDQSIAVLGPAPVNPRLRFDSTTGIVITEFLDTTGSVQTRSPSKAVLAYLRAGLGEDGRSKAVKEEHEVQNQDNILDA